MTTYRLWKDSFLIGQQSGTFFVYTIDERGIVKKKIHPPPPQHEIKLISLGSCYILESNDLWMCSDGKDVWERTNPKFVHVAETYIPNLKTSFGHDPPLFPSFITRCCKGLNDLHFVPNAREGPQGRIDIPNDFEHQTFKGRDVAGRMFFGVKVKQKETHVIVQQRHAEDLSTWIWHTGNVADAIPSRMCGNISQWTEFFEMIKKNCEERCVQRLSINGKRIRKCT